MSNACRVIRVTRSIRLTITALTTCLLGCGERHPTMGMRSFAKLGAPTLSLHADHPSLQGDVTDAMLLDGNVFVLQAADARVAAISSSDGHLLWRFGRRGAGPTEFASPTSMFLLREGGLGVVDPRQGRITLLSASGDLRGTISGEALSSEVHNACDVGAAGILAIHLPKFALVRFDSTGSVAARDSLRWPDPRMNEVMQFQQGFFARSHAGPCVIFSMRGNYFSEFSPSTLKAVEFHSYVEPYVFPKVEIRKGMPILLEHTGSSGAAFAAVFGDNLFVLAGEGSLAGRVVDMYSVASGTYRRSFKLPRRGYEIDVNQDMLLVLEDSDEGSRIELFRLPISFRAN
jgi:hypothetical protein